MTTVSVAQTCLGSVVVVSVALGIGANTDQATEGVTAGGTGDEAHIVAMNRHTHMIENGRTGKVDITGSFYFLAQVCGICLTAIF